MTEKITTAPKIGTTSRMLPPIVWPTMEIAGVDCCTTSSTTSSASSAASATTLAAAMSTDCALAMSIAHVAPRMPDRHDTAPVLLPRSMGRAAGANACSAHMVPSHIE